MLGQLCNLPFWVVLMRLLGFIGLGPKTAKPIIYLRIVYIKSFPFKVVYETMLQLPQPPFGLEQIWHETCQVVG